MSWIEIHIITTANHVDMLSNQLTLLGALAVTLQDAGDNPLYEPSSNTPRLWNETVVIGLFDQQQNNAPIMHDLEQQRLDGLIKSFQLKHIADEDWVRRSLDQFKPIQFGKRLWVCPSWHAPPEPNAVNIILDPGLAFGTGTHPSTALCLEWLDEHIQSQNLIIDYGCGSGILALAALKLGAKRALAVDIDSQALTVTLDNAQLNGIYPPRLQTFFPHDLPTEKADILIANILAQPIIDLAPFMSRLVIPTGFIVLSGILITQIKPIIEAYSSWFDMQPIVYKENWARLVGVRNDLT